MKEQLTDEGTKPWRNLSLTPTRSHVASPVMSVCILQMQSQRKCKISRGRTIGSSNKGQGSQKRYSLYFSRNWSQQNCNQETAGTRCSHDRQTFTFFSIALTTPGATLGCSDSWNRWTETRAGSCLIWQPPVSFTARQRYPIPLEFG